MKLSTILSLMAFGGVLGVVGGVGMTLDHLRDNPPVLMVVTGANGHEWDTIVPTSEVREFIEEYDTLQSGTRRIQSCRLDRNAIVREDSDDFFDYYNPMCATEWQA